MPWNQGVTAILMIYEEFSIKKGSIRRSGRMVPANCLLYSHIDAERTEKQGGTKGMVALYYLFTNFNLINSLI